MAKKINDKAQVVRFAAELKALSADVTENDRKKFMAKYDKGATMVSNYLNGKVANVDIAAVMLVFFRAQIKKRNKLINQK